jgi:tripartite ATP-independent transporter DctM subunit
MAYQGLAPWVSRIPGRLLVTNIASCTIFAAISGSSIATAATIGKVAIPSQQARNYMPSAICGSLAAGGTLGILIPPSLNLIVYGAMTNQSVGRLFIAGVIPGLILASLFALFIILYSVFNPKVTPGLVESYTWKARVFSLKGVLPFLVLIAAVLGSIYTGIATPTEAAAIGVFGAIVIALALRRFSKSTAKETIVSTAQTTAWVCFIYLGAQVLGLGMSDAGLIEQLTHWAVGLPISPNLFIICLMGIYVVLGCLVEGFSLMIITLPIVYPIILKMGFDPIWFAIMMILMCETALITPPVGLNLFVIQGIAKVPSRVVIAGSWPYVLILTMMMLVMLAFPTLATWLPSHMYGIPAS